MSPVYARFNISLTSSRSFLFITESRILVIESSFKSAWALAIALTTLLSIGFIVEIIKDKFGRFNQSKTNGLLI